MNKQLSEHFNINQFPVKHKGQTVGYVEPESMLLTVLERLWHINKTDSIKILNAGRTIKDHIRIYKDIANKNYYPGKEWHEIIPWGSYHLPAFNKNLRAVDISIWTVKPPLKPMSMLGDDIYKQLLEIEKYCNVKLGKGIGKNFVHIDVRMNNSAEWWYPY